VLCEFQCEFQCSQLGERWEQETAKLHISLRMAPYGGRCGGVTWLFLNDGVELTAGVRYVIILNFTRVYETAASVMSWCFRNSIYCCVTQFFFVFFSLGNYFSAHFCRLVRSFLSCSLARAVC
jgi:hypothetical protein